MVASVHPELVAGRTDAGRRTELAGFIRGCPPTRRSSCDNLRMNGYACLHWRLMSAKPPGFWIPAYAGMTVG